MAPLSQWRKGLFTREDKFNVHKLCGFPVLAHYAIRIAAVPRDTKNLRFDGSLLTPARKPVLNLATTLGCAAASAAYARAREASATHVVMPFTAALVMMHLHLLLSPLSPLASLPSPLSPLPARLLLPLPALIAPRS